jgi:uroporphyrinogen-III decarboxylase
MPAPSFSHQTDLNRYCVEESASELRVVPADFVTEARALGARIVKTSTGALIADYLYERLEDFETISGFHDRPPIREVLNCIEKSSVHENVRLNVQGPYSVLAALVEPSRLYKWLIKNSLEIKTALKAVTAGLEHYIREALARGAKVISIADSYANPETLGRARYREFAAEYLFRLLTGLARTRASGVIHLCPHSSLLLEQYGCLDARALPIANRSQENALLELAARNVPVITGHQCLNRRETDRLYLLTLTPAGGGV